MLTRTFISRIKSHEDKLISFIDADGNVRNGARINIGGTEPPSRNAITVSKKTKVRRRIGDLLIDLLELPSNRPLLICHTYGIGDSFKYAYYEVGEIETDPEENVLTVRVGKYLDGTIPEQ